MKPDSPQELERLRRLSDFDLDYSDTKEALRDLTRLAAKIAGTSISVINLIDAFTQWSIANYGMESDQAPREDSVCQYTILVKDSFEVKDLSADERFRDKDYVLDEPRVRYYFGVPLQTNDGFNIGALCVLDQVGKEITPDKVELLKIIANEIVNRLAGFQMVRQLKAALHEARETQRKVAHDIRGPLGGIINLSQLITSQGMQNRMSDVLEYVGMIEKTGVSLLDLANEILSTSRVDMLQNASHEEVFTMRVLKDKLEKLYTLQAAPKQIHFDLAIVGGNETAPIPRNKLLQIAGNLISNAIKFTPSGGAVHVELELANGEDGKKLMIRVKDSGTGMDDQSVDRIHQGNAFSHTGTEGELGFGLGLALVRQMVDELGGQMKIISKKGEGTFFELTIPISA